MQTVTQKCFPQYHVPGYSCSIGFTQDPVKVHIRVFCVGLDNFGTPSLHSVFYTS
jgi:hypothetical protein